MADSFLHEALQLLGDTTDEDLLNIIVTVLEDRPAAIQALVDWAVPDRAYARTSIFSKQRFTGKVKSFNAKHSFGFISCEATKDAFGSDVFLHIDQMGSLQVGTEVSFAILLNKEGKPQAFDVKQEAVKSGVPAAFDKSGVPAAFARGVASSGARSGSIGTLGTSSASWFGGASGNGKGSGKGKHSAPVASPYASRPSGQHSASGKSGWINHDGWNNHDKQMSARSQPFMKGAPPTSAEMPGVTDRRWQGVVKMFKEESGFGFIECEELLSVFQGDVFAHAKQIAQFPVGSLVSFEVFLNKDMKPQAKEVQPASQRQQTGDWQPDAPPSAGDIPGITDRRFDGTIKSIFEQKGYGFIDCEELRSTFGVDTFVHQKQLGGFSVHEPVTFEVFTNKDGKPQAKNLAAAGSDDPGGWVLEGETGPAWKRPRFN